MAKGSLHWTPFAFVVFAQVIMERSAKFGENLPNFLLNPVHDQCLPNLFFLELV